MHGMVGFKIKQAHPPHSLTASPTHFIGHPPTQQPLPLHSPTLSFHSPTLSLHSPTHPLNSLYSHFSQHFFHILPVATVTVHTSCPRSLGFQPTHSHHPLLLHMVGTHYSPTDQLPTVHRGQSPYQLGSSERSHPEPPAVCSRGRWIIRLTNTHTHACIHTHTHTHTHTQ